MPGWLIVAAALAYAALLFWIAWRFERSPRWRARAPAGVIYALSIGVYCTSWTFFGAVGTAATEGWTFLPIYLGPALVLLFGGPFLRRLYEVTQRENLASIPDLLSSRYGKSRSVAALAAGLGAMGLIPYIALQLRAIAASSAELMGAPGAQPYAVALIGGALAGFGILFGARRYHVTARTPGLVAAIAAESIVKLVSLTAIAVFALWLLAGLPPERFAAGEARFAALFAFERLDERFFTVLLLATCAIVCLPRQFYVAIIACADQKHLRTARWLVPGYLAWTAATAPPIALAGLATLPAAVPPDLFVLDLPLAHGAPLLALVAFLGGLSAATGMVVVESVALATMISNDLAAPLLLRAGGVASERDIGRLMLAVRRGAIVAVIALACVFTMVAPDEARLADMGLISFAAVAQFAPALLGALYWPQGNQVGARWGLGGGMALWAYTLLLPAILGPESFASFGPLHPQGLFGVSGLDPLTHGVLWSLGVNGLLYIGLSRSAPTPMADRARVGVYAPRALVDGIGPATTLGDLAALAERFVGAEAIASALRALEIRRGRVLAADAPLDVESARELERLIAGVIGASSARTIIASALRRGSLDVADVATLLGEARGSLEFSRDLLFATLQSLSQGVSVVDKDLNLLAWNGRYLELFDFPPGLIRVGRPIADVIRYNAVNGECGPGEVEQHVERRLAAIRRGRPHSSERVRPNGTVLKSTGNPMPGGAYVTSFTDITEERRTQEALRLANESLEARVIERTEALSRAKQAADAATQSKTRFLAAASHDLLQPLNAARLFTSALRCDLADRPEQDRLAHSVERSIAAADTLLRALLDISKLDAGGVIAQPTTFPLADLLGELVDQFAPIAHAKGLALRQAPTRAVVCTDRALLRSALQNFVSNAVRYTERGGVLLGCRTPAPMRAPGGGDAPRSVRIEVWDTGPGIPPDKLGEIFEEFTRLEAANPHGDGVGLGLAIVERIAAILAVSIEARSRLGRGSVFAITAPLAQAAPAEASRGQASALVPAVRGAGLAGLSVLCVDNEPAVLAGMVALIERWGGRVRVATCQASAMAAVTAERFDAALVDYHLAAGRDGLAVLVGLKVARPHLRLALVTAGAPAAAEAEAERMGALVFQKPVDAEALRAFLAAAAA